MLLKRKFAYFGAEEKIIRCKVIFKEMFIEFISI